MRIRPAAVVLILAIGALVPAVLGLVQSREPAVAGSLDARPPVATRPASVETLRPAPVVTPSPPDRVRVPTLGIDADVVPVGVSPDRVLEVPAHPSVVGWYRHGAVPGATTGSAVLASHVDTAADGAGAFFELSRLEAGAAIEVQREDGTVVRYSAVTRLQFPKDELPEHDLFTTGGAPRLVLLTCGGAFDDASRSYADNVVLIAVPVPDAPG